jgi:hypothetical protein
MVEDNENYRISARKKREAWDKVAVYSTVVCLISLLSSILLKEPLDFPISIVGGISGLLFFISMAISFLLRRRE